MIFSYLIFKIFFNKLPVDRRRTLFLKILYENTSSVRILKTLLIIMIVSRETTSGNVKSKKSKNYKFLHFLVRF